ncbi:type VI secretion protein [Streptomyces sp. TRM66268-LWL]|uniref:Type VI secretion protein n=1 Tax=Streptomyces polyasparticus TaxID=2767826 RepID=A0ABR7SUI3_9ACTN|nr:type VI secretion protein [Streptomyces polyasparticus]
MPDGLLLGFLGFVLGLSVLVWTATGLAGLFAHGSWPSGVTFGRTPLAIRHLVAKPHDVAGAWPTTPAAELSGYGLFWGLVIGQAMILVVLTVFVMGTWTRWRAVRAAQRASSKASTDGASTAGASTDGAASTAGASAPPESSAPTASTHPESSAPTPSASPAFSGGIEVGPRTSSRDGVAEHLAPEAPRPAAPQAPETLVPEAPAPQGPSALPRQRQPLILGGPRTRKPLAVQAIQDAEGAAVIVTSDPTVWEDTKDARAKLGPVLLYDPGHLCDTPARMHWNPAVGCEDKQTAKQRAEALLAPVRPTAKLDAATAATAETLLRSYLHAAALDSRAFKHVHRWAQGSNVQEAVRTLRTHTKAAPGSAGELEAELTAHPERRDMAQELTARALSSLFSIHIREACTPNRTDALTLDSFADEGGTLYVVGEAIEDPRTQPGAMPLLTALVSSVVERGRRMAERSSAGRLDPPLTLVLDDVAAVAPLPQLPELLTPGTEHQGLVTLALLRSREQGRSRWPDAELPV